MAPRTRSRIAWLVALVALVVIIREASIRRHENDLHAWPRPSDDDTDGPQDVP